MTDRQEKTTCDTSEAGCEEERKKTLKMEPLIPRERVADLKHAIQVKYKIATQHQVLVVNGGECMVANRRVCSYSAGTLDPRIIQPFLAECRDTIAKLDNQNMKAIKGLEDRLYALDQMIASCKKLVNEQKELAQGFLANQKRAENLKDTSVLPDLCLSHANQLMIMLTNHRKLLDIKQKCTTAKQELANNLQVRLKWCCYVMLHADQDGEKLQALLRLLTELLERVRVVEALGIVPQMYCLAVVEVVRRKIFIKHYREWASALVKDGKQLYEAEKAKRDSFGKLFSGLDLKSQEAALRAGPDVLIATPGRLIDHLHNTPSFELSSIEILILDEADSELFTCGSNALAEVTGQ
ncbi:UNVERIFIED_CONTAM: hypothetical protein FKN15_041040 [Acipenser sinensis]